MSIAGIGIEAEGPGWLDALDVDEVRRAAEHACLDDDGVPAWLGALLERHPGIAAPPVIEEMAREWRSGGDFAPFLERATHRLPLPRLLQRGIVALVSGRPPRRPRRIAAAAEIVTRLDPTETERADLPRIALRRLLAARRTGDPEVAVHLRLVFRLDAPAGAAALQSMLDGLEARGEWEAAFSLMRGMFDRHRGSVVAPKSLGPDLVARLAERAYAIEAHLPAAVVDNDGEGHDRPFDIHDPHDALLSALAGMDGEAAHVALLRLAHGAPLRRVRHGLRERARETADRAAERPRWTEAQVVAFEERRLAPIARGGDLLELVCSLLDTLDREFRKADMSEIKHAGKGWTLADPSRALTDQLAEGYRVIFDTAGPLVRSAQRAASRTDRMIRYGAAMRRSTSS